VSQERRRAREARQRARRRELETAAAQRGRQEQRAAMRARLRPSLPRRRRRFGQLSTRALAQVVVLYLAVQAVFWIFVPSLATRAALGVVSLAFLLVLVRTRKRTPR
jgi:Flp pilus assembly protein TadB